MKIRRWSVWSNSAQRFDKYSYFTRAGAVRRRDKIIKSQAYNLGIGSKAEIPGFVKIDLVVTKR